MNEAEALAKMIPPGQHRQGKFLGGVIQIWVTRSCDKSCFGCTQGSNLAAPKIRMPPAQFEQACISLKDYWGVVGMFGGNPALHPDFEELCDIMRKHIKPKQRGLWCNKLFGKGEIARKTFNPAVSNLNVHQDQDAYDEFKRTWPEARPFGLKNDSRHSPVHIAMQDLIADEGTRWDLISNCDINQHWSAMLCVFRGQLRGYFCEVAAAQAMLHQEDPAWPDLGVTVDETWWKRPMTDFAEQVRFHCHRCGVPLRGYGELANATQGTEQTSATHADVFKPKKKERPVQIVTDLHDLKAQGLQRTTDYLGNAKR